MVATGNEAATLKQLKEMRDDILNEGGAYPVGSIYLSVNSTNPSTLFGGTWKQIQNVFLLAAGSQYIAGSTGGEAEHTLTVKEMPSHNHSATFSIADGISFDNYYALVETRRILSNKYQTVTSDTGGNQPHNNMPPYLAVYMWQRTA